MTVLCETISGIALIGLNAPPVNALGIALRRPLSEAVEAAFADPDVGVIAIYGCGRGFSAGADIAEFGKSVQEPVLHRFFTQLEAGPKPVVSVLHGIALGGGLELALATHYRIGLEGLSLGLPEVTLGLIPGAGGTQRLSRLIGADAAIDMIAGGRRVNAEEALGLGILDQIASGNPRDIAFNAAEAVLRQGLVTRRCSDLRVVIREDFVERAKARCLVKPPFAAQLKAIDLVAAAGGSLAEGLAAEREAFAELLAGPDRRGLIHAFTAERETRHFPEQGATPRRLDSTGVIGGGTMGAGIAAALLQAGIPVTLTEADQERGEAARGRIAGIFSGMTAKGRLSPEKAREMLSRLQISDHLGALREADLIIEAVFEDPKIKAEIFTELGKITKTGAILASNTSYLDISQLAAASGRPADVLGLHFFSPAHIMRLLEVVVTPQAAPDAVATALDLASRLKKVPVRAGNCDGFIGNRILAHYRRAADYMLMDGASFQQIDRALEEAGFALGPFATADLSGLEIGWAMRKRRAASRPPEERYVTIADQICEGGDFGRKTGRGWYDYSQPGKRTPSDRALQIVADARLAERSSLREFSPEEIRARYLTAMIIESVRVLADGIAQRPIDIDAVMLFGYGFPRHLGGPLHYADELGAAEVIALIRRYAQEDPDYWQVPPLLVRLAQSGGRFSEMNGKART